MRYFDALIATLIAAIANFSLIAYLIIRRMLVYPSHRMLERRRHEYEERIDAVAVSSHGPTGDDVAEFSTVRRWERDLLFEVVASRMVLLKGRSRSNLARLLELSGVIDERIGELRTGTVWKRRLAADVLGRSYSATAISPLTLALRDTDTEVRSIAAKALGRLDVDSAIPYVASLLKDIEEPLCAAVADTLIGFGEDAVSDVLALLQEDMGGSRSAERVRFWSVTVLANIRRPSVPERNRRVVVALHNLTGDSSMRVRRITAVALGRLGSSFEVDALAKLLGDASHEVRREAATALGIIGDERALEVLLVAFEDPVREVAIAAGDALAEFGERGVLMMRQSLTRRGLPIAGSSSATEVNHG